jgi:hypothetical protein
MKRREFNTLLGHAAAVSAAWPFRGGAQQKAMPLIGHLSAASHGPSAPGLAAFHQGLGEAG